MTDEGRVALIFLKRRNILDQVCVGFVVLNHVLVGADLNLVSFRILGPIDLQVLKLKQLIEINRSISSYRY